MEGVGASCLVCESRCEPYYCTQCNIDYNKERRELQLKIERLRLLREQNRILSVQIEEKSQSLQQIQLMARINATKRKLEEYKQLIATTMEFQTYAQQGIAFAETKISNSKSILTLCRSEILSRNKEMFAEYPVRLEGRKEKIGNSYKQLQQKRRELVSDVMCFVPLNPESSNPEKVFRICNLYISSTGDYSEMLRKADGAIAVASAMGYIALLLRSISAYLDIPLLYDVRCAGCRSQISNQCTWLTLDPTNIEEFMQAVRLIENNIAYLCHMQGIEVEHPEECLVHLRHLVGSNTFGAQEISTVQRSASRDWLSKRKNPEPVDTTAVIDELSFTLLG